MGSRVLGRSGLLLPELVTVPRLMYTLREHYTGAPGVRPYLLLLIKDFILTVSVVRVRVPVVGIVQFLLP